MFDENGSGPSVQILVTTERWDAVDAPTERNIWLVQVLTAMGGVSDTTPPGVYQFNVEKVGDQMIATLEPATML